MPMTDVAGLAVATFAQRPDLLGKVFGPEIQSAVPEFMRHDPVGALYYRNGQIEHYSKPAPSACRLHFATAPRDARNCLTAAGTR